MSYTFTGSQTKAGSSDNSFEVLWNGTAKEKNYTVTITPGKLIVTRNPDVPSTGDGTNLPLWAGLLLASTLALAAALRGLSAPKKRGRHSA